MQSFKETKSSQDHPLTLEQPVQEYQNSQPNANKQPIGTTPVGSASQQQVPTESQSKKNKTIQLFMSELFDEKAPSTEEVLSSGGNQPTMQTQVQIEASNFYSHKPSGSFAVG